MTDREKGAAAAVVLLLWLTSKKAKAGDDTSEGPSTMGEPADGSARPSASGTVQDSGTYKGLSWVIWSEPSTPGYGAMWHSVRNSAGELMHYGSRSSFASDDAQDIADAIESERDELVATIDEITAQ